MTSESSPERGEGAAGCKELGADASGRSECKHAPRGVQRWERQALPWVAPEVGQEPCGELTSRA